MEKRPLGRTGYSVSVLGLGAGPIGYLAVDQHAAGSILNLLLDSGVNLIDTAASYRGAEETIGAAVSHRRNDYVLVSKCGSLVPGVTGEAWSASVVAQTVDRSLARLRTDHLDVMLLHSCDLETLKKGEALGALIEARDAGKVRHVGYSGDNETVAYAATLADVAVIETSINLCDQANIDKVLPVAREKNVGVLAKRPVANAAWREPSEQSGIYANYAQSYHDRLKKMGIKPSDFGLEDSGEGWTELALRFTIAQPGVTCAIIGTTKAEHARSNLAMAARGPLPDNAIRAIRDAFARAEKASGEAWVGLT